MTYSVVARDPDTGAMGVAVQSHWFSVGSVVSWARAGAGAVATQSVADVSYGPLALHRMAAGDPAAEALSALLARDELASVRQVGVVDRTGRVAVHTGPDCIAYAGHASGDGFSCQANMMARDTVPAAMAAAFEATAGPLPDRMMAAMRAAEAEGGDVRGRQSAAMLVVPAVGHQWETLVDIRIDDHPDPVGELERLRRLASAYHLAEQADELLGAGRIEEAGTLYATAHQAAPDSAELLFWAGLAAAHGGDPAGGAQAVRRAADANPGLLVLLERLSPEIAPAGDAVRAELGLS